MTRELNSYEMGLLETVVDFIAKMNALVEESIRLGMAVTDQARMLMVAMRLRDPWRTIAMDKMDRENGLT